MGRQNKDQETGAVFGSSILLLQERFRQLQRLKEMRKERQLIVFPSVTDTVDGAGKFMTTSAAEFEDRSLALGLNSNMNQIARFRAGKPQNDEFPSTDAPRGTTLDLFEKYADYVDTSLHL